MINFVEQVTNTAKSLTSSTPPSSEQDAPLNVFENAQKTFEGVSNNEVVARGWETLSIGAMSLWQQASIATRGAVQSLTTVIDIDAPEGGNDDTRFPRTTGTLGSGQPTFSTTGISSESFEENQPVINQIERSLLNRNKRGEGPSPSSPPSLLESPPPSLQSQPH